MTTMFFIHAENFTDLLTKEQVPQTVEGIKRALEKYLKDSEEDASRPWRLTEYWRHKTDLQERAK